MQKDHDLIKQFQNGNHLSFEELVRKHLPSTIGFFFNITGDKMLSEDLSQDVFFKLHKSLKKFRFDASFSTYFYRVKLNTANSWLRTNKWKNLLHLDQIPDEGREDNLVEKEWTRRELWDAISRLPNKQRVVVVMRIAQELSYKEIHKVTGLTEGTAKVNFHHALKSLKKIMNNERTRKKNI